MGVKVGDKVRIIQNSKCHMFPIGSEVTVVRVDGREVTATNETGARQYISGDFEPIEPQDQTLELIANLSAEVARLRKRLDSLEPISIKTASVVINVRGGASDE